MWGLGRTNMNEKCRLGFILYFCHLWLSVVKRMTLNILCTFWWFLTLQVLVPGLSDTWDACVWTGSVRWDHPNESWFRRQRWEELATHGGESAFWVQWSNDAPSSGATVGVSGTGYPFIHCGGAMMALHLGQQWEFLVLGPKRGRWAELAVICL